jgi:hypothetical protein
VYSSSGVNDVVSKLLEFAAVPVVNVENARDFQRCMEVFKSPRYVQHLDDMSVTIIVSTLVSALNVPFSLVWPVAKSLLGLYASEHRDIVWAQLQLKLAVVEKQLAESTRSPNVSGDFGAYAGGRISLAPLQPRYQFAEIEEDIAPTTSRLEALYQQLCVGELFEDSDRLESLKLHS